MQLFQTKREMALTCRKAERPLGLVPTMGYLHQGHLALIERARLENQTLAVSIFVNPTQFGSQEDLAAYPHDRERDLALLEEQGVDLVFAPSVEEMYPPEFDSWVQVGQPTQLLEGEARPGHFRGVATVVTKLLNIVRPDRAYFGQKDGQQAAVVKRLAEDLDTAAEIIVVPTVREADGLACSSRNVNLDPRERAAAPVIFRSLEAGARVGSEGHRTAEAITSEVRKVLATEPLITEVDYVSLVDAESMSAIELVDRRAMLAVAVRLGQVRLIDNILLG